MVLNEKAREGSGIAKTEAGKPHKTKTRDSSVRGKLPQLLLIVKEHRENSVVVSLLLFLRSC